MTSSPWFEEVYHPHWRQRIAIERVLVQQHTGLQEVLIFENATLGRVLVLDGIVQASERDEFIYHEMMTHVPIMAHGAAREVLIIGGGDGGALEEALKHASIARVTMVELDPGVVEIARAWLPDIHRGAFDEPRAELLFTDGVRFVAETNRRFDVIILDTTDPTGAGEALFTEQFYVDCRARLRSGGILVGQSGNPMSEPERIRTCRERLARVFADASFILSSVPAYLGGPFVFAWGCDDRAKRRLSAAELAARPCPSGLRCYTPAVHAAAFVHPPWLLEGG
jgi:spermidine synthase